MAGKTKRFGTTKPIYFDIETGGLWATGQQSLIDQAREGIQGATARPSSILSISTLQGSSAATSYSQPVPGSWLSEFSARTIMPQLAGKKIISEKESLQGFINKLRENPDAPIAGYNIAGFDLQFMQGRARVLGLGDDFREVIQSRTKIDVGLEARDLIVDAINNQISNGVFSDQLGGRTFASLEMEYFGGPRKPGATPLVPYEAQNPNFKILSQVRGFQRGGYQGRVEGWKLGPVYEMYSKWAGKDPVALASAAHQSSADVEMTKVLHGAIQSGRFKQFVNDPEFGSQWLQMVHGQRAASAVYPRDQGSFIREAAKAASETTEKLTPSRLAFLKSKEAKFFGAAVLGSLAAGAIYNTFSGYDDSYNTVEGLNHKGLAQLSRKSMTDFGSGYTGINVQGLPVDEDIINFRQQVLDNKNERDQLKAKIKELELEAQANLGSFEIADFMLFDKSIVEGMNQQRRDLRRINLERFNIEVEDADSLVLKRKGFFNRLFGKDILVRLAGVDAPEVAGHSLDPLEDIRWNQSQLGGEEASKWLRERIAQSRDLDLVIATEGKTYGRYLGAIVGDNANLNLELVRAGQVSALPFGPIEEDIVSRAAVAQAERQAINAGVGIQAAARYQAIDIVSDAAGRDITYNTLTRLDKLAENLNVGRYATFLQALGSEKRALTTEEEGIARALGSKLRNQYSSRFSGKDDSYNSIEALKHGSMAAELRKRMTDFGSGWRRNIRMAWNVATNEELGLATGMGTIAAKKAWEGEEVSLESMLDSKGVVGQLGMYAITKGGRFALGTKLFSKPWDDDPLGARLFDILKTSNPLEALGAEMSLAHRNRMLALGLRSKKINQSANTVQGFVENGMAKASREKYGFGSPWRGAITLPKRLQKYFTDAGMAVQNIDEFTGGLGKVIESRKRFPFWGKSARRKDVAALADLRSRLIDISSDYDAPIILNPRGIKMRTRSLKEQGYKVTRQQVERETLTHERVHQTVRQFGLYEEMEALPLPQPVRQEFLNKYPAYAARNVNKQNEEYLAMAMGSTQLSAWEPIYDAGHAYFKQIDFQSAMRHMNYEPSLTIQKTKVGWRQRFERPFGIFFSGRDDNFNKLEGLGHKGIGQKLRKWFTPFGSGWDALRGLVKGAETFEDMIKSKGFKTALSQAKQGRQLGEASGFGKTFEMTGSFRGQEFKFARKIGSIGKEEASTLKKFGHDFAPSFYDEGMLAGNMPYLDMELFSGTSLHHVARQRGLTEDMLESYEDILSTMHSQGYVHGDAALSNVMLTKEGRIGLIDFGGSGKVGEAFETYFPGVGLRKHNIGRTDMSFSTLPKGAAREITEEGEEAIVFSERSFEMDAAYARDAWDRFLYTRAKDEATKTVKDIRSTASTATAISGPKATLQVTANAGINPEAPTANLMISSTPATVAIKKTKRANMQQAATKTVFVNASGGRNSKM